MQTTTLQVTGMTCQHCVVAVTKALQAVPGVQTAQVDLNQAHATVNGTASVQELLNAVARAGYGASSAG
jgi:copper chaperone CopZ